MGGQRGGKLKGRHPEAWLGFCVCLLGLSSPNILQKIYQPGGNNNNKNPVSLCYAEFMARPFFWTRLPSLSPFSTEIHQHKALVVFLQIPETTLMTVTERACWKSDGQALPKPIESESEGRAFPQFSQPLKSEKCLFGFLKARRFAYGQESWGYGTFIYSVGDALIQGFPNLYSLAGTILWFSLFSGQCSQDRGAVRLGQDSGRPQNQTTRSSWGSGSPVNYGGFHGKEDRIWDKQGRDRGLG